MRFILPIILITAGLLFTQKIFAAEISFSNSPETLTENQEIALDVHVMGAASNTTNYIRAAFFHPDSPTSYFGYVLNSQNNWYNGTPSPIDAKQFQEVQIDGSGSWSGQMKIKIDMGSPYFKGNGAYQLKVGRYTASATSVSNWSDSKQVLVQGAPPTAVPTQKPTPIQKIEKTHTVTPSPEEDVVEKELEEEEIYYEPVQELAVLGETSKNEETPTPTPTEDIKVAGVRKNNAIPFLIGGAVILIIGCAILLIREYKKQKEEEI